MTTSMPASATGPDVQQIHFDAKDPQHLAWAVELWNDATANELPLSQRFLQFNLTEDVGMVRGGRIALAAGRPAGFVLCSAHPGAQDAMRAGVSWLDAIAVAPAYQRRGIGSALLHWAENWLAAQGEHPPAAAGKSETDACDGPNHPRRILVGGGLRPYTPGVLADSPAVAFFLSNGYGFGDDAYEWDVARSLSDYVPPPLREVSAAARPAQPGQEEQLLAFLATEFAGRWHWMAERFLAESGRISDYMLLWTEEGVQGACRLTFEDSRWPIDRFYPFGLPRPWGQLGSIGVSAHLRGQGLGLKLLDAGLRRLHNSGINGCVIDWTTLLDFYAICGFRPYRKWAQLRRTLDDNVNDFEQSGSPADTS